MAAYGRQVVVRKVFLWGIASVYLFAFTSLYVQIPGLYGRNGLMPAKIALTQMQDSDDVRENFYNKPTLLWYMPYLGLDIETGMELLCIVGIVISILVMVSGSWRVSIPFFILWYLYYSLYQVGQTFLWFQWDILLMEAGFLAVLVSPLSSDINFNHHDNIMLWLVKWLAFRLMFCSGVVKLTSQCPTWWGLTALNWHYESQCIPTGLAWYAHQLPEWFQRLSVVLVYVILMVFSWLFFAPVRSLRIFSFYSQLFFQILIISTGNYNFFNILAILLLLAILDDRHIQLFLPSSISTSSKTAIIAANTSWSERIKALIRKLTFVSVIGYVGYWMVILFDLRLSTKHVISSKIMFSQDQFFDAIKKYTPVSIWVGLGSLCIEILHSLWGCMTENGIFRKLWSILQWAVFSFAAVGMFAISLVPYTDIDYSTQQKVWPVIKRLKTKVDYLELVHAYGLFRSMTGVGGRPELNIEGSNSLNGPWKEYGFLYKPVAMDTPLPLVAPHQPRLDWQMWFAALGVYNHNPWFVHLVYRLLHGQQEVLDLMGHNPFPDKPPRYIRANLYTYHFTRLHQNTSNVAEAIHNAGLIKNWWKREFSKEYLPILDKAESTLTSWLNHFGYAKNDSMAERPSGQLYMLIRYLRSLIRSKDPFTFILTLYVSAIVVGYINTYYIP